MLLHSEDFFKIISVPQHHLHPNSRILSEGQILKFRPVARQNPPVLQPLEMVCSVSKHPLSSVSGRRRYNTLDFPMENRVPIGRFRPYWKPRSQGTCCPFTISARLYICTHKQRKRVCEHRSINAKNPQRVSPARREILWGFVDTIRHAAGIISITSVSLYSSVSVLFPFLFSVICLRLAQ